MDIVRSKSDKNSNRVAVSDLGDHYLTIPISCVTKSSINYLELQLDRKDACDVVGDITLDVPDVKEDI